MVFKSNGFSFTNTDYSTSFQGWKKDTFPFLEFFHRRIMDYPFDERILQLIFPKRLEAGFARNSSQNASQNNNYNFRLELEAVTPSTSRKWQLLGFCFCFSFPSVFNSRSDSFDHRESSYIASSFSGGLGFREEGF